MKLRDLEQSVRIYHGIYSYPIYEMEIWSLKNEEFSKEEYERQLITRTTVTSLSTTVMATTSIFCRTALYRQGTFPTLFGRLWRKGWRFLRYEMTMRGQEEESEVNETQQVKWDNSNKKISLNCWK